MAKRFTDTDKWKKVWYRKLRPTNKCFWQYLLDNCNHAGIWEVDFELAGLFIGEELNITEIEDVFSKQYVSLREGKKWFIKDFVDFQYGELNEDNRAHHSAICILKKEGAYKGLVRSLQGRKVMVKDKELDKAKDKDKELLVNRSPAFMEAWSGYISSRKSKPKAHAVKLLLGELENFSAGDEQKQIKILNYSAMAGYPKLYALKENDNGTGKKAYGRGIDPDKPSKYGHLGTTVSNENG